MKHFGLTTFYFKDARINTFALRPHGAQHRFLNKDLKVNEKKNNFQRDFEHKKKLTFDKLSATLEQAG